MDLLEWLGESYNPGPTGSVNFGKDDKPTKTNGLILVRLIVAMMLIGLIYYIAFAVFWSFTLKILGITSGAVLFYCLIAYFVRPEPDMSNIGWLGGLMDNPFRYSDDVNRFLMFLKVFLMPGCFIAESIIDGIGLFFCKRQ